MSDRLYRKGGAGMEPFYPETTADRVRYGAGSLRRALDALTWHVIWTGECESFQTGVTLPEEALNSFLFALRLDVGAAVAYAAKQANGDLLLRYLCPVTGADGALTLYHGQLTLHHETLLLSGMGYATALGGAPVAHECLLEISVMATSREELNTDEPILDDELALILAGKSPGQSELNGLTQAELQALLAGTTTGIAELNGLTQTELEAILE